MIPPPDVACICSGRYSRYSDSLRIGRSGDRIPVCARFSAPVQTDPKAHPASYTVRRVQLKCDGTRWRTGGEVKGKLANGVGRQYSHATSEHGVSSITTADAHTSAASSRLNWRLRRFKWTHPFRRKTKCGFCACAITFQTQSTRLFPGGKTAGGVALTTHSPVSSWPVFRATFTFF